MNLPLPYFIHERSHKYAIPWQHAMPNKSSKLKTRLSQMMDDLAQQSPRTHAQTYRQAHWISHRPIWIVAPPYTNYGALDRTVESCIMSHSLVQNVEMMLPLLIVPPLPISGCHAFDQENQDLYLEGPASRSISTNKCKKWCQEKQGPCTTNHP